MRSFLAALHKPHTFGGQGWWLWVKNEWCCTADLSSSMRALVVLTCSVKNLITFAAPLTISGRELFQFKTLPNWIAEGQWSTVRAWWVDQKIGKHYWCMPACAACASWWDHKQKSPKILAVLVGSILTYYYGVLCIHQIYLIPLTLVSFFCYCYHCLVVLWNRILQCLVSLIASYLLHIQLIWSKLPVACWIVMTAQLILLNCSCTLLGWAINKEFNIVDVHT